MTENQTYTFILIKKTGEYLGWSKAPTEPPCGQPELLEWVDWGKELPEDIDSTEYKLIDGNLVKG